MKTSLSSVAPSAKLHSFIHSNSKYLLHVCHMPAQGQALGMREAADPALYPSHCAHPPPPRASLMPWFPFPLTISWVNIQPFSTFSHDFNLLVFAPYGHFSCSKFFHLKKQKQKNPTLFPWQCSRIKTSNVHALCPHFRNLLNGNLCTHMKKYTSNMYKYVLKSIMWGSKKTQISRDYYSTTEYYISAACSPTSKIYRLCAWNYHNIAILQYKIKSFKYKIFIKLNFNL